MSKDRRIVILAICRKRRKRKKRGKRRKRRNKGENDL